MTTNEETPAASWPAIDDDAVLFTAGRLGGEGRVIPVTVERLTKTRVVLSNGDWLPRDRLSKRGGTWDPPTELLRPDDERVVTAKRLNHQSGLRAQLESAHEQWWRNRRSADEEKHLIKMLGRIEALLEAIS